MKKIQILLSAYNGEKHIREQLDSYTRLCNFDEVKVLIRDDGSTDSTPLILKEYSDRYGFEVITGENVGLNESFHILVQNRDRACEYFAFSDHDDCWLEDKLTRATSALEGRDTPTLYAACSYITDESLNIVGKTFVPKKKLSFYNAMVQNVCVGHTQVINASLAELLEREYSSDIMVNDYWIYLLASAVGECIYDSTPTTLYRQHATNEIGYSSSTLGKLKVRMGRVRSKKSVKNALQLRAFCECYGDLMSEEYKNEAERFFKKQRSFFTRLSYVFSSRAYRQTPIETLIFKTMYLFGRYNINKKPNNNI